MSAARGESPGESVPVAGGTSEWMCFSLAATDLAVPGAVVREVAAGGELERDLEAPKEVLGLLSLHHRRIPVLDLGAHLRSDAESTARRYVLVVEAMGRLVGLPATAVRGLESLAVDRMRPLPASARSGSSEEILGAYPRGDRWVMLLDVDQLVRTASA